MVDIPLSDKSRPCAELLPLADVMKPLKFAWTPEGMAIFCPQHEDGMAIFISRSETLPRDMRRFKPTTMSLDEMNVVYDAASAMPDQMGMLGVESDKADAANALAVAGPVAITLNNIDGEPPEELEAYIGNLRNAGVFHRCAISTDERTRADYRFFLLDTDDTLYADAYLSDILAGIVSGGMLMVFGDDVRVALYEPFFEKAGAPLARIEGVRLWSTIKP